MKLVVFIFTLMLFGDCAFGHTDEFWKSLENNFIKMEINYKENLLVESRFPRSMRFLLEGLWGWHPGTAWDMKTDCDLAEFKAEMISRIPVASKVSILENFLKRCRPIFSKNSVLIGLKALTQKGSLINHPFFKYAFLNFPGGIKTRALLGIKTQTKQDLIIVRPGIFASTDELIAERYLLYLLNELNGFHVIVLENSTSGDHLVNNQLGIIAGPKEAFENLYLIDHIKTHPQLGPLVNKIHVMGISLGGNGVLLSSLINKKYGYKYFDKTLLLCPVVNLRQSFSDQMGNGFTQYIIDWWGSRRFKDLKNKREFELEPALTSLFSLSPRWIRGAWAWFEKKYDFQPTWQSYFSKDFYSGDFKTDYEFFKDQTPLPKNLFVLSSKTDPIVHLEENYDKLLARANEDTFFYKFDNGFHCSFAYTFQWKFLDGFISGIFESVDLKLKEKYFMEAVNLVHDSPDDPIDKPEIRSVEIAKFETGSVELLVYFLSRSHLRNGHVVIPLANLALDKDHVQYDVEAIRNYIKRFVQTKAEIGFESNRFFIKI